MRRLVVLGALLCVGHAIAQSFGGSRYVVEPVISGLASPTQFLFVDPTTILICEKNTGRIKRYKNFAYDGIAITLPVSSIAERGLLGICKHPDFPNPPLIYVYYSLAGGTAGTTFLENRIDRFTYSGGVLTFDRTILSIPTDPAQTNGPIHNSGVITIGPDRKLYAAVGEMNRGAFSNPRIEGNTAETAIAGCGGIVRLNLDGTIPPDNPFVAHPDERIRRLFTYGMRNSFGLTFDAKTNKLWYSENGPTQYDEINYVPVGGMNGGWRKIIGPDSRNAVFDESGGQSWNASDLVYLSNSYYSDPEFSFLATIGATAVCFLRTIKVDDEDRDTLLLGEANNGQLYRLRLNSSRDAFELSGNLADRVADTNDERLQLVIGDGWSIVTDIKVGPDKYVYVLRFVGGALVRLRPVNEYVAPNSAFLVTGSWTSGRLEDLEESDDVRITLRPGLVVHGANDATLLEALGNSPTATPSKLAFSVECQCTSPAIQLSVSLFDFSLNQFVKVAASGIGRSDTTLTTEVHGNLSRFVGPESTLKARLGYRAVAPVLTYPWLVRVDLAGWRVSR
jgi:glucose/arabinose dehydrogenase